MHSSSCIEQVGVVDEITNGKARVLITSYSACSSCESKGVCGIAESVTKQIFVPVSNNMFSIGEHVVIQMHRGLGLKAVILAYMVPFLLLIFSLFLLNSIHINELAIGLISLCILVPYYVALYFFRKKINKTFTFTLKKVN
jgi:positive regulator of sigma E activity